MPERKIPKTGEIWMCSLTAEGSVRGGYRPVFILSNNLNNTHSHALNIIPLTSKMKKRHLPVHVILKKYEEYGLKVPSTLLVEQITTIPVKFLDRCIGAITDAETLNDIRTAIGIQFPIMATATKEKT